MQRLREQLGKRDDINSQLSQQATSNFAQKNEEISKLKNIIIERDGLRSKLVADFEQELMQKEIELKQLRAEARKSEKEIDSEKVKLRVELKEIANKQLLQELSKLKDEELLAKKRLRDQEKALTAQLREKDELLAEQEQRYRELLDVSRKRNEERSKQLVRESAERELATRAEAEKLGVIVAEQKALLSEKEQQVEDAIKEFSIKSNALLSLKAGKEIEEIPPIANLRRREREMADKEKDLLELVRQTEDRVADVTRREKEMSLKEELLLREQESLKKELEILEQAGIEIGNAREDLARGQIELAKRPATQPIAPVEAAVAQQQPITKLINARKLTKKEKAALAREKARAITDAKLAKKQAQLKQLRAPKLIAAEKPATLPAKIALIKQKIETTPRTPFDEEKERHRKEAEAMFSGERDGFSEMEEIMSLVDIAIQHGDTLEKIKNSLASSGYAKDNIEKALSMIKKAE